MDDDIALIATRFLNFSDEARGSSELYTRLSPEIAGDPELLGLLLDAPPFQRRANLLFAAAHYLLLANDSHPVARHYASVVGLARPPDESTFGLFRDFCLSHADPLRGIIATRQTQTNEVRRTAAFLPVFQQLSGRGPVALVEVGASAGLNLLVDRYRYKFGEQDWLGDLDSSVAIQCEVRGRAPPLLNSLGIASRVGIDTHPLDVCAPDDARWLQACIWPEQTDRQKLIQAALSVARENPPELVQGDALDVLGDVLSGLPKDLPLCVFNSATLFYFSPEECGDFVALLDRFGDRELHWISLEGGAFHTSGARLPFDRLFKRRSSDRPTEIFGILGYARWRGGRREDHLLGRADMHGRWIEWEGDFPDTSGPA